MTQFIKPMLASARTDTQLKDLFKAGGTFYAYPKLDGVRATIQGGRVLSRSLKPIHNHYIQKCLGHEKLDGLDGELIIGAANDKDVFKKTSANVRRIEGEPDFSFYVFDHIGLSGSLEKRSAYLQQFEGQAHIKILPFTKLSTYADLQAYEDDSLKAGYEGVILRNKKSIYRSGRSTRDNAMVKIKRFNDAEAKIIDHQPLKENGGKLGAFLCEELNSGVQFSVGTGFSDQERTHLWQIRNRLCGQIIKYKYFEIGMDRAPRHPVFLGFRDRNDLCGGRVR